STSSSTRTRRGRRWAKRKRPRAPEGGAGPARAAALAAALWSALGVLDPSLGPPVWPALPAAFLGLGPRPPGPRPDGWTLFLALLTAVYAVQALVRSNLGADSRSYFVWLPWLIRGGRGDLGDTLQALGMVELPGDSPLRRGLHPIGPALLWSP